MPISTKHLDYLQRTSIDMSSIASGPFTSAPAAARRLWRVKSIGKTDRADPPPSQENLRLPTSELFAGLHGYGFSIAYHIVGTLEGVSVSLGGWQSAEDSNASPITLDTYSEALCSSLAALYPMISLEVANTSFIRPKFAGLVIGAPNLGKPGRMEQPVPIDRLIRALQGTSWQVLILAVPVIKREVRSLRHCSLNEQRAALALEKSEGVPSPLTSHYSELLSATTNTLTQGLSVGIWRTAVYLLADPENYFRLESVWRSIFAGEESILAPLIAERNSEIGKLAVQWAMPDTIGAPAPGAFRHPYEYQTLLTSPQLATYIHLPERETSGFAINLVPTFDVVRTDSAGSTPINLGQITSSGNLTRTQYAINVNDLKEHTFISGVTGSGKTTTIHHLLKAAFRLRKPFLVIEPAKTEYREMIYDESCQDIDKKHLKDTLQVFTLGSEIVSPFRLNPFEKCPDTPISVHLELLRSVFAASFGMWPPLPQVLEISIHAVYRDRGWDLTNNVNDRLDDVAFSALAFPTLTDLVAKVEEIIPTLGYDEKIASDIRAALVTRINSLRVGGKGRMLDTQYSIPIEFILETPTILELEDMGDDDDKAFMMGLIFIRVVEHLRAHGRVDTLRNLVVIEEAHRLLTNTAQSGNPEQASPRAKAIETFTNMLSEIRAYGLGLIIADQIPSKLVPDVIKNTSLKIAHRVVAEDDRAVLAGAMAMKPEQMHSLSYLEKGWAAVFSRGDDAPILVNIQNAKPEVPWPDTRRIVALRREHEQTRSTRAILDPSSEYIGTDSKASDPARKVARLAAESKEIQQIFATLVQSITEDVRMLDPLWDSIVIRLKRYLTRGIVERWLHRWVAIEISGWFARRRSTQNGWTYSEQQRVEELLRATLLTKAEGDDANRAVAYRQTEELRDYWRQLHSRSFDPFPHCETICDDKPSVCLYRQPVVESLSSSSRVQFEQSHLADCKDGSALPLTWQHCLSTAKKLIVLKPPAQQPTYRAALCYAQHQLLANSDEVRGSILNTLSSYAKGGTTNG